MASGSLIPDEVVRSPLLNINSTRFLTDILMVFINFSIIIIL